MILLVYCIISLFYDVFVLKPALHDIFYTPKSGYSLFVLKVPLNNNQLVELVSLLVYSPPEQFAVVNYTTHDICLMCR